MVLILPKKGEDTKWVREFKADGNIDRYLTPQNPTDVSQNTNPIAVNVSAPITSGFIYVPTLGIYVAKERTLKGKNWNDCQNALHSQGERMSTIPEFVEFFKYLRTNPNGVNGANSSEVASILDDILTVRNPYRAEWLDADFKFKKKKLYVNYNVFENGKIITKKEQLEECLMKDKQPGIDLTSWLDNSTKQGLPKTNVADGTIWYWFPRSDNNSVAWFGASSVRAYLNCSRNPSDTSDGLGVRAIRHASP